MGVEIPHGHALGAARAGGHGGQRDLVEIAEPHGLTGGGMMPRWAHERKSLLMLHEREIHGGERGAD